MKKIALHTVLVNSIYGPNCQFIKVDRKMKHHQRPLMNPYLCKIACLAPAVKKKGHSCASKPGETHANWQAQEAALHWATGNSGRCVLSVETLVSLQWQ